MTRTIQGVTMVLPWSHRLLDYSRQFPAYGQNLVGVAKVIARVSPGPLQVIDIGANIGDSALQILAQVDARVLCVEGDPYWFSWLGRNTAHDSRVSLEQSLLVPSEVGVALAPRRAMGTTSFRAAATGVDAPAISAEILRQRHPGFDMPRLIKSDTDGYDTLLVPYLAETYSASSPVLFFEYDPAMTVDVGFDRQPLDVFARLRRLGYEHFAYWDNFGGYLGAVYGDAIDATALASFDQPLARRGYHYWDVAAVTADDHQLFEQLADRHE